MLVLAFASPLQCISFHDKSCPLVTTKDVLVAGPPRPTAAAGATPLSAPPPILIEPPTPSIDTVDAFPLLPCLWPKGSKTKPEHTPGSSYQSVQEPSKQGISESQPFYPSLPSTCCYLTGRGGLTSEAPSLLQMSQTVSLFHSHLPSPREETI